MVPTYVFLECGQIIFQTHLNTNWSRIDVVSDSIPDNIPGPFGLQTLYGIQKARGDGHERKRLVQIALLPNSESSENNGRNALEITISKCR